MTALRSAPDEKTGIIASEAREAARPPLPADASGDEGDTDDARRMGAWAPPINDRRSGRHNRGFNAAGWPFLNSPARG